MEKSAQKLRLDALLIERDAALSPEKAKALILAGQVWSGQQRLDKPGLKISRQQIVEIRKPNRYVSRGGNKLEHALNQFLVQAEGKRCLDVGASTGGFTDCLLQHGASHVIAVDVGHGQIDVRFRTDSRVYVAEGVNVRHLTVDSLPGLAEVTLVTLDVSFISALTLLPPVKAACPRALEWIVLFKPQFELDPKHLRQGGIVKDPAMTQVALSQFIESASRLGFRLVCPPIESSVAGKRSGNMEWLVHFTQMEASAQQ